MNHSTIQKCVSTILNFECPALEANKNLEKPFIIVAPSKGTPELLRVYAYGGNAGGILYEENISFKHTASKEYNKYLLDKYTDGHKRVYHIPMWLTIKDPDKLWEKRTKLDDQTYMNLTAAALQNRSTYHKERCEQTRIARNFMNVGPNDESMLVTDIEYVAPKLFTGRVKQKVYDKHEKWKNGDTKNGRKSLLKDVEPDFILFDGKSFGVVEFKYNGDSLTGEAGLREHMLDFTNILAGIDDSSRKLNDWRDIKNPNDLEAALSEEGRQQIDPAEKIRQAQWELFWDCCKNMEILLEYGLIPETWRDKLELMKEKYDKAHEKDDFDHSLLWCGFLFVGGDERKIKKSIETQLKDFKDSKLNIRFQISKDFPDKLTMDKSLSDILSSTAK